MPELPRPRDAADDAQREASLAAFEAIIGQSSMGFFLADPGLRLIRVNERFAQVFGKPVDEYHGRTPYDFLPRVEADNARRREIAARYRDAAPQLAWQATDPRHVYHLCVARVPDRDAFRRALPFDTGVHYPRALTQQPAYASYVRSPCPEAEKWAAQCISFPCFPEMTDDEIEAVCRAIR